MTGTVAIKRDDIMKTPPAEDDGRAMLHPESSHRKIGTQIAVMARQLRQCFDERVEAMGVTRAKFLLIATVSRNPGVTQRVIAQKLEVTDVTAGRLIDRVSADGLIERRENPDDRRAYCVFLTPAAKPLLDALGATVADFEVDLFEGFTTEETDQLSRLLGKLSANLGTARIDGIQRRAGSSD